VARASIWAIAIDELGKIVAGKDHWKVKLWAAYARCAKNQGTPRLSEALMKMKKYDSFNAYLADQPPKNRTIIRALRKFVKRLEPDLQESVKWGNGCWLKGKAPVSYVYSAPDYVQFGFIRGSSLKDPKRLLEGNGQYVRHIKVHKTSAIDEKAFSALLRQAAR
jgi:hypothetical protein